MVKFKEGDVVLFHKYNKTYKIAKILHQEVLTDYVDLEFEDSNGNYHHYKNDFREENDYYDGTYEILNGR